ncbi:MAG: glycosyltransferase family 2 protein, partial [Thermoplasmata archaeon]|nr:glycosyltransferase family 2 protein [Thermoplasmata archaeon]
MEREMQFSICTTNYQCAHALDRHLESVFDLLKGLEFEYIVVDNKSKDRSMEILKRWEGQKPNMKVLSKKCTMGEGRQISFTHSKGDFILVMDTDTVYYPVCEKLLNIYLDVHSDIAIQTRLLEVFLNRIWEKIGGRGSLNAFEDVDMWIRIWELGKMMWYPIIMGENVKDEGSDGRYDFLSTRYNKREQIARLLRKECDLLKTTEIRALDLEKIAQ